MTHQDNLNQAILGIASKKASTDSSQSHHLAKMGTRYSGRGSSHYQYTFPNEQNQLTVPGYVAVDPGTNLISQYLAKLIKPKKKIELAKESDKADDFSDIYNKSRQIVANTDLENYKLDPTGESKDSDILKKKQKNIIDAAERSKKIEITNESTTENHMNNIIKNKIKNQCYKILFEQSGGGGVGRPDTQKRNARTGKSINPGNAKIDQSDSTTGFGSSGVQGTGQGTKTKSKDDAPPSVPPYVPPYVPTPKDPPLPAPYIPDVSTPPEKKQILADGIPVDANFYDEQNTSDQDSPSDSSTNLPRGIRPNEKSSQDRRSSTDSGSTNSGSMGETPPLAGYNADGSAIVYEPKSNYFDSISDTLYGYGSQAVNAVAGALTNPRIRLAARGTRFAPIVNTVQALATATPYLTTSARIGDTIRNKYQAGNLVGIVDLIGPAVADFSSYQGGKIVSGQMTLPFSTPGATRLTQLNLDTKALRTDAVELYKNALKNKLKIVSTTTGVGLADLGVQKIFDINPISLTGIQKPVPRNTETNTTSTQDAPQQILNVQAKDPITRAIVGWFNRGKSYASFNVPDASAKQTLTGPEGPLTPSKTPSK